jgi:hypothetical protein
MTIVNDDSRVVNKLEASLTDDASVIIYDRHIFIVQATGQDEEKKFYDIDTKCVALSEPSVTNCCQYYKTFFVTVNLPN